MKQKTQPEMESVLRSYSNYKGTKKDFCKTHGIKEHTLYYWQRKLRELPSSTPRKSDFIKLEISDRVSLEGISIHYPNGNRVSLPKVVDHSLLENLIRLDI